MPMSWVCAALAGGAVAAWIPPHSGRLVARRSARTVSRDAPGRQPGVAGSGATPLGRSGPGSGRLEVPVGWLAGRLAGRIAGYSRPVRRLTILGPALVGAVAVGLATARFGVGAISVSGACAVSLVALRRVLAARAAARERSARRDGVKQACDILAGELRAGRTPDQALEAGAGSLPLLREVAAIARMGGDVPGALLRASHHPGADGLARVAAAWSTAERSGAGLADVLDRLVAGLREDEETRAEVTAQLAAPRATARLLALLPLAGLALGSGIGSDPFHVLLQTPYGLGCLVLGGGLAALGIWWVERLARAAEDAR